MVIVHGDHAPDDEPFFAAISQMREIVQSAGSLRLVVYAAGNGGPNARQRVAFRLLADLPLRAVLISDSAPMRALITAAAWVMQQPLRATSTRETAAVIAFLELNTSERLVMNRVLIKLCEEGGFPKPQGEWR